MSPLPPFLDGLCTVVVSTLLIFPWIYPLVWGMAGLAGHPPHSPSCYQFMAAVSFAISVGIALAAGFILGTNERKR